MKQYLYLFCRTDIDKTYQAIQAAHAAWELGLRTQPTPSTCHFAFLEAKDERDLL